MEPKYRDFFPETEQELAVWFLTYTVDEIHDRINSEFDTQPWVAVHYLSQFLERFMPISQYKWVGHDISKIDDCDIVVIEIGGHALGAINASAIGRDHLFFPNTVRRVHLQDPDI